METNNEICKWCGCFLPLGAMATCFESPNAMCERTNPTPEEVFDPLADEANTIEAENG